MRYPPEVDVRARQTGRRLLGLREPVEVRQELLQPQRLGMHRAEVGRCVRQHTVLGRLNPGDDPGERRAQLVREVLRGLLAKLLLLAAGWKRKRAPPGFRLRAGLARNHGS